MNHALYEGTDSEHEIARNLNMTRAWILAGIDFHL